MNASTGKYLIKNTNNGTYQDLTTLFDGLAIMKVDGLLETGEPVNIYTAQWVNSQVEDFMITTMDELQRPVIIRKNVDIEVTFAISRRYATNTINELTTHDNFINYITSSDVWIKSVFLNNKAVHCICLQPYKPTMVHVGRANNSFITGTIKLHCLGD